jgi:hypothetical protein
MGSAARGFNVQSVLEHFKQPWNQNHPHQKIFMKLTYQADIEIYRQQVQIS